MSDERSITQHKLHTLQVFVVISSTCSRQAPRWINMSECSLTGTRNDENLPRNRLQITSIRICFRLEIPKFKSSKPPVQGEAECKLG